MHLDVSRWARGYTPEANALVIPLSQSCLDIAGREVALEVGSGGTAADRVFHDMPGTDGNLRYPNTGNALYVFKLQ